MDAFYASVEQRDQPALAGLPVAVGGRQGRGVVATASYEARAFGVRSAMPMAEALRRCPGLIVVPPRFSAYREVSRTIRQIFLRHAERIEPLSLDEAYLDVSHHPLAVPVARAIKAAILAETGLTASAGVSFNKFLAKTASGMNKPDGLTVVRPEDAQALIDRLDVGSFHGVGPRTAARLREVGIHSGLDLRLASEAWLVRRFGVGGAWLAKIARGIDERPVEPNRPRRSVSVERTFARDLGDEAAMLGVMRELAEELHHRLSENRFRGQAVIVKWRTVDFVTRTRRASPKPFPQDAENLWKIAVELLVQPLPPQGLVRLLGLGVSDGGHDHDRRQLELF